MKKMEWKIKLIGIILTSKRKLKQEQKNQIIPKALTSVWGPYRWGSLKLGHHGPHSKSASTEMLHPNSHTRFPEIIPAQRGFWPFFTAFLHEEYVGFIKSNYNFLLSCLGIKRYTFLPHLWGMQIKGKKREFLTKAFKVKVIDVTHAPLG